MTTRIARTAAFLLVAAFAALGTACTAVAPDSRSTPQRDAAGALPQGDDPVTLDPADFTTEIDNPYWPMTPGTRWTYRETDAAGAALTVVVTVTHETKRIVNGVTARVVRDTVWSGDELIEDTLDWYAQDGDGAIWYLGEDTAEFDNGVIASRHGSFEAGVDGALPGIAVPAHPAPGMAYRQEYYKGEAEDNGAVLSINELAEVPYGQFADVLLTKDTITFEPDVLEYKLYAPGVGLVLTLDVSGGSGGREELVRVEQVAEGAGTGPLGAPR